MDYLGETLLPTLTGTPYDHHDAHTWALQIIEDFGGSDGGDHKSWVLDQVARVLLGTPVAVRLARWANGQQEYRYATVEPPSQQYLDWVARKNGPADPITGETEYDHDTGTTP